MFSYLSDNFCCLPFSSLRSDIVGSAELMFWGGASLSKASGKSGPQSMSSVDHQTILQTVSGNVRVNQKTQRGATDRRQRAELARNAFVSARSFGCDCAALRDARSGGTRLELWLHFRRRYRETSRSRLIASINTFSTSGDTFEDVGLVSYPPSAYATLVPMYPGP